MGSTIELDGKTFDVGGLFDTQPLQSMLVTVVKAIKTQQVKMERIEDICGHEGDPVNVVNKAEFLQLQSRVTTLESELKELKHNRDRVAATLELQEAKNEEFERDIASLKTELAEARGEENRLKGRALNLESSTEVHKNRLDDLREDLDSFIQEIRDKDSDATRVEARRVSVTLKYLKKSASLRYKFFNQQREVGKVDVLNRLLENQSEIMHERLTSKFFSQVRLERADAIVDKAEVENFLIETLARARRRASMTADTIEGLSSANMEKDELYQKCITHMQDNEDTLTALQNAVPIDDVIVDRYENQLEEQCETIEDILHDMKQEDEKIQIEAFKLKDRVNKATMQYNRLNDKILITLEQEAFTKLNRIGDEVSSQAGKLRRSGEEITKINEKLMVKADTEFVEAFFHKMRIQAQDAGGVPFSPKSASAEVAPHGIRHLQKLVDEHSKELERLNHSKADVERVKNELKKRAIQSDVDKKAEMNYCEEMFADLNSRTAKMQQQQGRDEERINDVVLLLDMKANKAEIDGKADAKDLLKKADKAEVRKLARMLREEKEKTEVKNPDGSVSQDNLRASVKGFKCLSCDNISGKLPELHGNPGLDVLPEGTDPDPMLNPNMSNKSEIQRIRWLLERKLKRDLETYVTEDMLPMRMSVLGRELSVHGADGRVYKGRGDAPELTTIPEQSGGLLIKVHHTPLAPSVPRLSPRHGEKGSPRPSPMVNDPSGAPKRGAEALDGGLQGKTMGTTGVTQRPHTTPTGQRPGGFPARGVKHHQSPPSQQASPPANSKLTAVGRHVADNVTPWDPEGTEAARKSNIVEAKAAASARAHGGPATAPATTSGSL